MNFLTVTAAAYLVLTCLGVRAAPASDALYTAIFSRIAPPNAGDSTGLFAAPSLLAQPGGLTTVSTEPTTLDVWPGLAPGETKANTGRITDDHSNNVARLTDVTQPHLHLYPASGPGPHPAVMVCPGGGYSILAIDLEGSEIARWLNRLGFTAAVLDYRVPDKRDAALQDAERALSLLRVRAQGLGIDPNRLGVLGFSAGGHLAARLATSPTVRSYTAIDATDQTSARPDFAVLVYPAYLIDKEGQPAPEVQPHAGMPPVFLTQTKDDPYLDVPAYASALQAAGVAHHVALYDTGGHGYGLRLAPSQPAHAWSDEAAAWLKQQTLSRNGPAEKSAAQTSTS